MPHTFALTVLSTIYGASLQAGSATNADTVSLIHADDSGKKWTAKIHPLSGRILVEQSSGIIAVTSDNEVLALSTSTGDMRWRKPLVGQGEGTPAWTSIHDLEVSASVVATYYTSPKGGEVVVFDRISGVELWRKSLNLPHKHRSLVVRGNTLWFLDASRKMNAVRVRDGQQVGSWLEAVHAPTLKNIIAETRDDPIVLGSVLLRGSERIAPKGPKLVEPQSVWPWGSRYLTFYSIENFMDIEHAGLTGVELLVPNREKDKPFIDLWKGKFLGHYGGGVEMHSSFYSGVIGATATHVYLTHRQDKNFEPRTDIRKVSANGRVSAIIATQIDKAWQPVLTSRGIYYQKAGSLYRSDVRQRLVHRRTAGQLTNIIEAGILSLAVNPDGQTLTVSLQPHQK